MIPYAEFTEERITQYQAESLLPRRVRSTLQMQRFRATPRGRAHQLLNAAKQRARAAKRDCTISVEWVEEQLKTGHCSLTGLPFNMNRGPRGPFSPSIDRIDCSKGYVESNCRLVVFAMNAALGNWGEEPLKVVLQAWLEKSNAHR